MTTKHIKKTVGNLVSTLSSRGGVFTAKKSYFWGICGDGSGLADKIKSLVPTAEIVDYGNHYHSFVGGAKAGSPRDSYFWVKFKA